MVTLDDACRRQQLGEGWFASLSDVPRQAISMGIRQILRAHEIIAVVPDARKAKAVAACCEGDISPLAPAVTMQEIAAGKEYPGGFSLLRLYTGGFALNFHKTRSRLVWHRRSTLRTCAWRMRHFHGQLPTAHTPPIDETSLTSRCCGSLAPFAQRPRPLRQSQELPSRRHRDARP